MTQDNPDVATPTQKSDTSVFQRWVGLRVPQQKVGRERGGSRRLASGSGRSRQRSGREPRQGKNMGDGYDTTSGGRPEGAHREARSGRKLGEGSTRTILRRCRVTLRLRPPGEQTLVLRSGRTRYIVLWQRCLLLLLFFILRRDSYGDRRLLEG